MDAMSTICLASLSRRNTTDRRKPNLPADLGQSQNKSAVDGIYLANLSNDLDLKNNHSAR